MTDIRIGNIPIGSSAPLVLFAGPCVIENREITMSTAGILRDICATLGIPLVFKSSYKKANRTSLSGFTGLDEDEALGILAEVKLTYQLPVVTDIHTEHEAERAAVVADVLQIPAFLSRQTELLLAAGRTGRVINIKKGQFLAPDDMKFAAEKVLSTGNANILLCERGTSFGYHDLVVDMRSLVIMRALGYPVIMDATHAVQIPAQGGRSGGRAEFIAPLARAAAAVGIDGLFLETHPDPVHALSDSGSQLPLDTLEALLRDVLAIDAAHRSALLSNK
jgi:2-dehydro-3-deoxyphosphooctonate aldolase (KDO 8-P synthase)